MLGRSDRKAALALIYVSIVLATLGFGITIPVLPRLIVSFAGDTAQGAEIFGLFVTIWSLMQFLFSPLIGALSDRFGRRPVLILSSFGLGVDYMVMALAPNLAWLLLGRILSGITASSYATAAAYVADVTPAERRAAAFGMVGAAWGIGFILGPAVGALNLTVQGGLVKRFINRFGERNALITGLIAGAAAFVVWGLAPTPDVFLLAIVVFAPIGFVQPALQSLMTRRVRPSEQGQLQGANASIAGLTGVLGPILFTLVFAWFIGPNAPATLPGMPFFVAAVLMLGSVAVAVRITRAAAAEAASGVAPAAGDVGSTTTRDP